MSGDGDADLVQGHSRRWGERFDVERSAGGACPGCFGGCWDSDLDRRRAGICAGGPAQCRFSRTGTKHRDHSVAARDDDGRLDRCWRCQQDHPDDGVFDADEADRDSAAHLVSDGIPRHHDCQKGAISAALAMAGLGAEVLTDAQLRGEAQADFEKRMGGEPYSPLSSDPAA